MGHSFSEVKENEIIEGLYEKADIIREAEVSWVNSYVRFLVAKKKLYGNIVGGEFTTPTEYEIYRTFFPRWLHILSPGAFDDSSSSVSSANEDGGGGGKDITELKALMEQLGERLEHQAPDDAQFIIQIARGPKVVATKPAPCVRGTASWEESLDFVCTLYTSKKETRSFSVALI